jgi:hypothetical protein
MMQNINIINIDIIHPQATKMAQITLDKRTIGMRGHSKTLNGYQSAKNTPTITIKHRKTDENRTQRYTFIF